MQIAKRSTHAMLPMLLALHVAQQPMLFQKVSYHNFISALTLAKWSWNDDIFFKEFSPIDNECSTSMQNVSLQTSSRYVYTHTHQAAPCILHMEFPIEKLPPFTRWESHTFWNRWRSLITSVNHLITNGRNYAIYPRILGGARWLAV